jgi:RHS repeat-associated protein
MHVINERTGGTAKPQPMIDTRETMDWERDYFAFGSDRTASGSDNDYQFTGQRKEDGTALHHFEYRELSTTLRRWLAPDPIWLATPWQSPYVYASNNPINRIDILGLWDEDDGFIYDQNGQAWWNGPGGWQRIDEGAFTWNPLSIRLFTESIVFEQWVQRNNAMTNSKGVPRVSAKEVDVLINGVPAWYVYGDRQNGRSGTGGDDAQLRDAGITMGAIGSAHNVKSGLVEFAVKGHGALDSGTLAYGKALRYTGVAGGVLGMGLSYAQIYTDRIAGNPANPWNLADLGVGFIGTASSIAAPFLVSNPAGWATTAAIGGGVTVYFTVRLVMEGSR